MVDHSSYVRPKPRSKYCGVYAIRHKASGVMYVGGSTDTTGRFTHHRFMLRRGMHKTRLLQELWTAYGEAAFEFIVLERCEAAALTPTEDAWIKRAGALNTVASAVTGTASGPSAAKRDAAKRRWARPEYRARRETRLAERDSNGRFTAK